MLKMPVRMDGEITMNKDLSESVLVDHERRLKLIEGELTNLKTYIILDMKNKGRLKE